MHDDRMSYELVAYILSDLINSSTNRRALRAEQILRVGSREPCGSLALFQSADDFFDVIIPRGGSNEK